MDSGRADVPGVDFEIVHAWMDEQGLASGVIEDAHLLAGGTQNVLVQFRRGSREYVLRRGPLHLRPKSNDALRREAQVLAALDGTDVPHPGFIAACTDESLMHGAVFYLMEPVDGFNPTVTLPALHTSNASVRHEMGLQAADAIAALGRVDYIAAGLANVGKPDGFLERQVERWMSELDGYSRFENYPGPDIPGVDAVAAWLDRNCPSSSRPGILHGDYHFANLMYRYDGPAVAAIVDWEMCTIGDPLLDLGWLVATWGDSGTNALSSAGALGSAGGLPSSAELVERYRRGSDRDLSAIDFYTVLACFKLGIVLEGSNARACAGKAPREIGDLLHATTLLLFQRACALIGV